VVGNGGVTVRRAGKSEIVAGGETIPIGALVELASGKGAAGVPLPPPPVPSAAIAPTALHAEIRRLEGEFDHAVAALDVDAAVRAVLELDDTLVAWAGDTTQSDAGDRGRAALRRMVARLGELARAGARDPRQVVGGFVDALLEARSAARAGRRYDESDRLRARLLALGVEVRDTPDGTEWELKARS
jgi:cysteinyl-tRNA synthetase